MTAKPDIEVLRDKLPAQGRVILARFFTRKLASALYATFVIGFILYLLAQDWQAVSSALSAAKLAPALFAVGLNVLALLIQSQTWALIQHGSASSDKRPPSSDGQPRFWDWTYYFLVGYLGRYIPGKVSMIVGRVLVLEPIGFSKRAVVSASLFENLSFLGAGLALGVVGFLSFSPAVVGQLPGAWAIGISLIFLITALIASPAPELCVHLALRLFRRDTAVPLIPLACSKKLIAFALSCISNLGLGLSYAFLLQAISPVELSLATLLLAGAVFMIAVVGGVLALFAPSGIGVREAILTTLLASAVDLEIALLAAILMRVLMCLVEISLFLVARRFRRA